MKVLITGSTGYIGYCLSKFWSNKGYEIHHIVRPQSNIESLQKSHPQEQIHTHTGEQTSINDIIARAKPDIVVHLASLFIKQHKSEDLQQLINSNILFGSQLLEAMAHNKVRNFINTGTIWQCANKQIYNPLNLYAATKQAFEDIIDYYVRHQNINAITLRLSDTYGRNDPRPKIFNLLSELGKNGASLDMTAGEQLLSLVHIDDVISAYNCTLKEIIKSTKKTIHKKYLIAAEQTISLRELVSLFQEIQGVGININWGKIPYDGLQMMEEWRTLPPPPTWHPAVSIEQGIKEL